MPTLVKSWKFVIYEKQLIWIFFISRRSLYQKIYSTLYKKVRILKLAILYSLNFHVDRNENEYISSICRLIHRAIYLRVIASKYGITKKNYKMGAPLPYVSQYNLQYDRLY